MNKEDRRAQILTHLQQNGHVHVRSLVGSLGVSEMTVRRDLELLFEEGLAVRTYGGALWTEGLTQEKALAAKAVEHTVEKERIAAHAASLVQPGDVVILDAGSTTGALARRLRERKGLTVITNDLKIAASLSEEPGIHVIVTGGTAQPGGYNLLGPLAEQTLMGITADYAFLGCDSVDVQYGLSTPSLEKVPIKQAIIKAARRSVLLADSSKFARRAAFRVSALSDFSLVVTDAGIPEDLVRSVRGRGIDIEVV